MSLKAFHVLFITVVLLLVLGCGFGALSSYLRNDVGLHLVAAIAAFACALGVAGYGVWFLRKVKGLA